MTESIRHIARSICALVLFLLLSWMAEAQQIVRIEYFYDKDPGIGKADTLPFSPADSVNTSFSIPQKGLSAGCHTLFIRTIDAAGHAAPYHSHAFYVTDSTQFKEISELEYFINKDSGVGASIPVAITTGDSFVQKFHHNISSLQEGRHFIHVRTKVSSGFWSPWQLHMFNIEDTVNAGVIEKLEYFIGQDSGVGRVIPVNISAGDSFKQSFTHNISALPEGRNFIHVRTKVSSGFWSPWQLHMFYIDDTVNAGVIEKLEYFIGRDSGVGRVIPVNISAGDSFKQSFTHNISALPEGRNFIHVRTKVSSGFWSPWQLHLFFIDDTVSAGKIESLEYFVDKDSGVGKNQLVQITPADSFVKQFSHSTVGLTTGLHFMHVRTKISSGYWSPWQLHLFQITDTLARNTIQSYTYSIDSSLMNNAYITKVPISPPTDSIRLMHTNATDTALNYGNHFFRIWAQQTTRISSVWHFDTFAVIDCPMLDTAGIIRQGGFCAKDSMLLIQNITPLGIWPVDSFNLRWEVDGVFKSSNDSIWLWSANPDTLIVKFSFTKKTENRCRGEFNGAIIIGGNSKDSSNVFVCAGDSASIHGKFEKNDSVYTLKAKSAGGCDSVSVVRLHVLPVTRDSLYLNVCQGDSVLVHGQYRKTSGVFTFNGISQNGCDSIVTIFVDLRSGYSKTDTFRICSGDTLKIHGKKYFQSGVYTDSLKSVFGCDSVFISKLDVYPTFKNSSSLSICSGDSVLIHGTYRKTSGNYVFNGKTVQQCDSQSNVTLLVRPVYRDTLRFSICSGDSIKIFGVSRRTGGIFIHADTTRLGCDSITTAILTVNPVYFRTDTFRICSGDTLKIHGKKYFQTGVFTDSLKSILGCDSVFRTRLEVYPNYNDTLREQICQGDSIFIHGVFRKQSGSYLFKGLSQHQCDSQSLVVLQVFQVYHDTLNISICNGDSLSIHGSIEKTPGTYINLGKSIHGCDSTSVIVLKVNAVFQRYDTFQICDGDSIRLHGKFYHHAGSYPSLFKSIHGCDSNYLSTVLVNPTFAKTLDVGLCGGDSFFFDGSMRYSTAIDTGYFKTIKGCDSTVILRLQIESIIRTNAIVEICLGDSVLIDGLYRKTEGVYTDRYKAVAGCDSLVARKLIWLKSDTTYLFDSICEDGTLLFHGTKLTAAGTYTQLLKNHRGCDSLMILNLFKRQNSFVQLVSEICYGDSTFAGKGYKKGSGIFIDTLTDRFGCDSIVELKQTELPLDSFRIFGSICPGDTLFTGVSAKFSAGVFFDTLQAANGCDSLLITEVVFKPTSLTGITDTICFNSTLNFFGNGLTDPGVYQHVLTKSNGCDSIIELTLFRRAQFKPEVIPAGFALLTTDTVYRTYQWYRNRNVLAGDTNRTINLTADGVYDVSVSNYLGCVANSWDEMLHAESFDYRKIHVYPNPARNFIYLEVPIKAGLQVYNVNGRKLKEIELHSGQNQMDVSGWAEGLYFLHIYSGSFVMNYRIIVSH